MKRQQKKEWKAILGNVMANETKLLNQSVLIISNALNGVSKAQLYNELYPTAGGESFERIVHRIIALLVDEQIIRTEYRLEVINMPPVAYYCLTGTGIGLTNNRIKFFRERPYSFYKAIKILKTIFITYLPLIISVLSLIVSCLTYIYTKQQAKH